MTEASTRGRAVVLSRRWGSPYDEGAFVLREVAAALSRLTSVEVLAPGDRGVVRPDGAFDVRCVGLDADTGWPAPEEAAWPAAGPVSLGVVDACDADAREILRRFADEVPTVGIVSDVEADEGDGGRLAVGLGDELSDLRRIGLHVPSHPMARIRSHVGLGFTGYLLVLSDRGPADADEGTPTPLVAWLATRFADRHVVAVENGVASVWRWRSLRGLVAINTRADLWRLLAHARLTVDLAPGRLVARECVESLHYGVPVVVPAGTPAARLAAAGGGLWFQDPAELMACVEALDDPAVRDGLGQQGQAIATEWYGRPVRFAERVRAATYEWLE